MPTRTTDGLDRTRRDVRADLEPSLYTARAAGLYSEVVWDRSRVAAERPARRPANDGAAPHPTPD